MSLITNLSQDAVFLALLLELEASPQSSQRKLAGQLGISLGRVNARLKTLVDRAFLEARIYRSEGNRPAKSHHLTEAGKAEKRRLIESLLHERLALTENLKAEIDLLKSEANRR